MKTITAKFLALVLVAVAFSAFGVTATHAQTTMSKDHAKQTMTEKKATMTDRMSEQEVKTVTLTQVPGEFTTKHLELAAGQYQFTIANEGVDHEVGFVIQRAEDKDKDLMKTAIPEAFVTAPVAPGKQQSTKVVNLAPGEYVYSCPLNPTPQYTITVK